MQLNGVLQISVPPAEVSRALERPEVLKALLPGVASVTKTAAGQYSFTLKKPIGFLELRQRGTIRLVPSDQGVMLLVQAAHRIGGAVDLAVRIDMAPGGGKQGKGTRITYDGKVEATGLAGRLLHDREAQVAPYIVLVFEKLKARIETAPAGLG